MLFGKLEVDSPVRVTMLEVFKRGRGGVGNNSHFYSKSRITTQRLVSNIWFYSKIERKLRTNSTLCIPLMPMKMATCHSSDADAFDCKRCIFQV